MRRVRAWLAAPPATADERPVQVPAVRTADAVVLEARIEHAGRIVRRFLVAQSLLEVEDRNPDAADVLLEVMVALDLAPKAPRSPVPVIPGRST